MQLTKIGKAVDELSTVHTIGGLHPRGLSRGSQKRRTLTEQGSALTGDQGIK